LLTQQWGCCRGIFKK